MRAIANLTRNFLMNLLLFNVSLFQNGAYRTEFLRHVTTLAWLLGLDWRVNEEGGGDPRLTETAASRRHIPRTTTGSNRVRKTICIHKREKTRSLARKFHHGRLPCSLMVEISTSIERQRFPASLWLCQSFALKNDWFPSPLVLNLHWEVWPVQQFVHKTL